MKSEWHRYNLKRRVADLPRLSLQVFMEKVALNSNVVREEDEYGFPVHAKKESGERQLTKKDLKRLNSEMKRAPGAEVDPETASVDTDITTGSQFSLGDSLADDRTETESNIETESAADSDRLSEFELISEGDYLDIDEDSYDVFEKNNCIYCNVPHDSMDLALEHMFKGHGLYIPDQKYLVDVAGLIEFLWQIISLDHECICCGFQGKNLESIQDHCVSKAHCRMPYEYPGQKLFFANFYQYPQTEAETAEAKIDDLGIELALPGGYKIGHRSMRRYYKQNLKLQVVRKESRDTVAAADRRLVNMGGLSVKLYDKHFNNMLKETYRQEQIRQRKAVNKNSKLNIQKHYRDPNL